jgi:YVTN family beta-propeller protein
MMKSKSWLMFLGVFLFCIFFSATAVYAAPFAYIPNFGSNNVSVIDTATNTVIGSPVPVGSFPIGVAVNPAGTRVYVANEIGGTVSVIDTATNTVVATIPVGSFPIGVAVNPAGTRVYVTTYVGGTVSVIDTATNTVVATITVGTLPFGVAVNPAGTRVYVTNSGSNTVSVIDTATNTVMGSPITVGTDPTALGLFIGPVPAPTSVPAMNLWGMILFMLIAGSGAMYYLRRKKRA